MEEMSITGKRLNKMCRLCVSSDVAEIDIFCFSNKLEDEPCNVIMKCAPVQITRCNEMPSFICQSCYTQLEKSYQFQKQVVQSEQTLRCYLQQPRTSNKQIKTECSSQWPSEDSLIHNTNTEIKIKCEPSEFQEVSDININLKEEAPSNYTSVYKRNEEIYIKSEIKEEPIDNYQSIPSEYTDNLLDTLSEDYDGTKIKLKKSKIVEQSDNNKRLSPADLTECFDNLKDGNENISGIHKKHKKISKMRYKCDLCNYHSTSLCQFNIHKIKHTGEKPYQCGVCNKCFSESANLIRHQRLHTGEKPYPCDVCNKRFSYSHDLITHQRVHTGERPYQCDVCYKSFSQSGHLKIHQQIHTGEKPYQCDVCNKSFSRSGNLKMHKRVHTGEKPHRCDVCNKCFNVSGKLRIHQRVHTGEKPYQCDVCNKCFSESSALKIHQRVHTSEKPYQCDVCNKGFSQSVHLRLHQRVHTGEKPYQCDVCNKCFSETGTLIKHQRVHTGEKPYQCDICNKRFTQSGSLNSHKRIH